LPELLLGDGGGWAAHGDFSGSCEDSPLSLSLSLSLLVLVVIVGMVSQSSVLVANGWNGYMGLVVLLTAVLRMEEEEDEAGTIMLLG